MKTTRTIMAGAALFALATLTIRATAMQDGLKDGSKAPEFSAKGTDGKSHTLASLSKSGPVVLYFVKIGCPVNQRAIPHFNTLSKTYKNATMVGVINGSMDEAKKWKSQNDAPFTLLADEDLKIIRGYKAIYSPWAVLVKDGKVYKSLPGGSKTELTEVSKFMADAAKTKVASLPFDGAPRGGG